MIDLSTSYAGLKLKSPVAVSAAPLCREIDNLRRMEDAGAGLIVLHSLFEEQINVESNELDRFLWASADTSPEAMSYYPDLGHYNLGPDEYLEYIEKAKEAVQVPIFASLNGVSEGGWVEYARLMEAAGADGIELNIYFVATDFTKDSLTIEHEYLHLIQAIKAQVKIPVAVKVGPYFSSMANFGKRMDEFGANALVLFNRFYQPDFDLETLEVVPNLVLSRQSELTLRLHWAAVLFGHIKADMAVTGGVHAPTDVIKCMLAGARVAMTTSALLMNGVGHIKTLVDGVRDWAELHEYESIAQMQGSMSQKNVKNPAAFERGNYMKVLGSYALSGK
jgi:dihydroorotate dehydrogenase (fumarate)